MLKTQVDCKQNNLLKVTNATVATVLVDLNLAGITMRITCE